MKQIKLFLASSIVEFKTERLEFERFIRVLDKIFRPYGMELDLIECEDLPKNLTAIPAQARINEQIPECDYFFMIVGKEAGEKSMEEFDIALDSMKGSGIPKVYVYFYRLNMDALGSQSESVQQFVKRLSDDLKHYFCVFMNVDTVKLDFLMELCRDFPADIALRFEDGQAVLQNEQVMTLANVPLYGSNTELTSLKEQKELLNGRFAELCARHAADPKSAEVYRELVRVSEERTRVLDRYRELEKAIFSLYKEIKSGGAEMTWYEKEARKQVELGNYAAAVTVLQDAQREKELEQAVLFADLSLEKISAHVRENQLLIKTLKAQKRTEENVSEIDRCYKESVELAIKYRLDNQVLYDYAWFLVGTMRDYEKTIELANMMKEQVRHDDMETLGDVYRLLGEAYLYNAHKLNEGRDYYNKAADLYDRLKDSSNKYSNLILCLEPIFRSYRLKGFADYEKCRQIIDRFQNLLITKSGYISRYNRCLIYLDCSMFYEDKGKHQSFSLAEEYALKALDISREDQNGLLNSCYGTLGNMYNGQKRYDDAWKYYYLRYKRCKRQYSNNSYNLDGIAFAAKDLGRLYWNMHKYRDAIDYTEEAVAAFRKLVRRNPLLSEYSLSSALHQLGSLYENIFDFYRAEKAFREAYDRRKTTLNRDDVYEHEVIYSCRALAGVLANMNKFEEAEKLYRDALSLARQYAKKDPANESYVRSSVNQLVSNCLEPLRKYDEAMTSLADLIDFKRRYLKENTGRIDEDLAIYLKNYASLLCAMDRAEEAIDPMRESFNYFEAREAYAEESIDYTVPLHNMAWVLVEAGHYEEAAPYLDKELALREKMREKGEEGLDYYLASTYKLRLDYCLGVGDYDEGAEYYLKSMREYTDLFKLCPDAFASNIAELHLSYAKLLVKTGQFEQAGSACQKAIDFYTDLNKQASAVYHKDLVDAYDTYVAIQKSI